MPDPVGAVARLQQELTRLPGVGPKSAERIAHFLLSGDRKTAVALADALRDVVARVRPCRECFNLTEGELCPICSDSRRDAGSICVVETPRDIALFERAGSFRGLYHVLGGRLAPLDGVGPDQLTLAALAQRVRRGGVREVILATSPTLEGDGTALYASNLLDGTGVTITKLARGLPSGSSLELANPQMLVDAMDGRRTL
ncbi:recombination mediator RecR [Fimbriiglobus ruber]|uniref:Recombination protein RecR n=1 Tax=Fimbriiglobus ruber TaxID=1908690 RepID=A0A225D016_9BACT|nr:recombination mediator RecR [Fimbriiglobus ruber]OWK34842.1 Recombination protein RecR [Fimbriiglobus ruber]